MKKIFQKGMCLLLVLVMLILLMPNETFHIMADTKKATLSNLGKLGSVSIGNKSESGTWYQTQIAGTPVFCLDLGLACHTGDVYISDESTYSSDSSNTKKALEAKIGYWYSETKKGAKKAWVYAQCLMWSVEEGETSKSKLTSVIKQVQSNTGYYDSKTEAELYDEIFGREDTIVISVKKWTYSGSGASRQVLLQVDTNIPEYKKKNDTLTYRQRITIDKVDEDGNPVSQVPFEVRAKNYKELYSFKYNGWGDAETGDADGESVFEAVAETDSHGRITYKFNYKIQSKDYGYISQEELSNMSSDEKKIIKEMMDADDIEYASDLTKSGAEKLIEKDLEEQMNHISNEYIIREINAGNEDMVVHSEYASGKTITITSANSWTKNSNGEWPETAEGSYADYKKAVGLEITNQYKKATVKVKKKVSNTSDNAAHGDTSVDGAEYTLYQDKACTQPFKTYTVQNGTFVTDYIRSCDTRYLKETKAPEGFFLDDTVYTIDIDGKSLSAEYTQEAVMVDVSETEKKGHLEIYKIATDGSTGPAAFEEGATFEVYLKSKGSYGNCAADERALLVIDHKGYAKTMEALAYGTYVIHQTKTGSGQTEMIADEEIKIGSDITSEAYNHKVYTKLYNNKPFEAYLKVIKKDGDTNKTVLKSNTSYQIFKVNKDGSETRVVQSYSDGTEFVRIDTFITTDKGEIMTVKPLKPGNYKIYEIDSATGLYIKDAYITLTIDSSANNYTSFTDSDGNIHKLITVIYTNTETKGKFTVLKTGETLDNFLTAMITKRPLQSLPLNVLEQISKDFIQKDFTYQEKYLTNQRFCVYATEDIVTQDNQGTNWYNAGEKVATIITGSGAEFTRECGNITSFTVDEETGAVTLTLPLGKYRIVEEESLYGYVLPEHNSWDLAFTWENAKKEIVLNSTESTDENSMLKIKNSRPKTNVSVIKQDVHTGMGVADTVFGLYSKDDIYNAWGEVIVQAGELLTVVTTDSKGIAQVELDLPLMSEGYHADNQDNTGFNSGDYYFKELSVSGSYYADETPVAFHLEYAGAQTKVIPIMAVKENTRTTTEISKVKLSDDTELSGAELTITDRKGNVIVSWISGNKKSVWISDMLYRLGYRNFECEIMESGNGVIKGLLHDEEYTLTETRPADGYATAESITFKLTQHTDVVGNVTTMASVKNADGIFTECSKNKVVMKDDTIKIEFSKIASDTKKLLGGAKYSVYNSEGKKVYEFITDSKKAKLLDGVVVAGETYTFREEAAPNHYRKAADVKITVKDTGVLQKLEATDERIASSPKTGFTDKSYLWLIGLLFLVVGLVNFALLKGTKRNPGKADENA